jgi:outer membrane protein OmpA-like peptidoglycan-associated protein
MNPLSQICGNPVKTLIATAVATVLLGACATAPLEPGGAAQARAKLTQLQSDPNLGNRAPVAIKEADKAVRTAEQPEVDKDLGAYRVYLADRKVESAKAQAETAFAEDQRPTLIAQRESARLNARTREADAARGEVAAARADSAESKAGADQARGEADVAREAVADSAQQNADLKAQGAELQRQIDVLQAKPTDRGLVLTLGDLLFTSGQADLKTGASSHLEKLVAFLDKYPDRAVAIEGYTDSVGSEEYNQGLSQRRAESVESYLTGQGIDAARLSASGKGESDPVAGNDSAAGRQQNRRVEVIISAPQTAAG